jgi:hypothetical protein
MFNIDDLKSLLNTTTIVFAMIAGFLCGLDEVDGFCVMSFWIAGMGLWWMLKLLKLVDIPNLPEQSKQSDVPFTGDDECKAIIRTCEYHRYKDQYYGDFEDE